MSHSRKPTHVVIMGAAGRDFHNFNMAYRDDPQSRVVAFAAAQMPEISGRRYPSSLAGEGYPNANGIPIVDETELEALCRKKSINQAVFAYSDVDHARVMRKASIALAAGDAGKTRDGAREMCARGRRRAINYPRWHALRCGFCCRH